MKSFLAAALVAVLVPFPAHAADPADIMRRIRDPKGGIIIVAHRGCHEKAPHHGWGTAPENSRAALLRCAAMGVDIMETDIRKTRDGNLVVMHDEDVERTTDGTGAVADMTLAQLKALRLRDNEGGPDAPLTGEAVLTLDEMLAAAKGRIVLNLDVKAMIYAEVIDAVVRAGAEGRVIVKTTAGIASTPLASIAPYDRVPFMVIPTGGDPAAADLPAIIARQMAGRIRPIAIELPYTPSTALPAIAAGVRAGGIRLWANTLLRGFVTGSGGDTDALRDPAGVWGRLFDAGVSMFQTDEPEALVRYRDARAGRSATIDR